MANLVAVLATTHHPFFYRASTAPPESKPDFADEWMRKVMAYREGLRGSAHLRAVLQNCYKEKRA